AAEGTITGVPVEKTAAAQVTASFTGTKMTATNQQLASATYTYSPDSAIDPDTYTADIVLTVAAV
ncbi:MAG: hypothetical protein J6U27_06105, partial [Spirochaetales bacterium]|nr:hypothetical protein [Spirochaetales bacterium]